MLRQREVLQHRLPEPSRTKSLSCHLRLHAVPAITHITASVRKSHQSGREVSACMSSGRLIDLNTGEEGDYSGRSSKLNSQEEEENDVSSLNNKS